MEGYGLIVINGALVLAVVGAVFRAGMLEQRVKDQSEEIKRLRDRVDEFVDNQCRYPRPQANR